VPGHFDVGVHPGIQITVLISLNGVLCSVGVRTDIAIRQELTYVTDFKKHAADVSVICSLIGVSRPEGHELLCSSTIRVGPAE
jgi:hypothetical protein